MKSKVVNGKRLWYLANGSLVKRSQHPNHMEKRKQRYFAGKEKENAQFKKWYADPKNRKRKLESGRLWRLRNKDRKRRTDLAYVNSEHGYLMGLWNSIKKRHTNLTKEQFFKIAFTHKEKMKGWRSGYSGEQMTMQRSIGLDGEKKRTRWTNVSVDRLDNHRLYSYDNIIFCTWKENAEKGAMPIKLMHRVLDIIEERKHEAY